jgi:hypothetical protein
MSDYYLPPCCNSRQAIIIDDMAKVRKKTEIATSLGGIFHVRELFSRYMDQFIETEKYDANMTYKKFTGISPDVRITLPYPKQLIDNIDEWVLWVAEDLKN